MKYFSQYDHVALALKRQAFHMKTKMEWCFSLSLAATKFVLRSNYVTEGIIIIITICGSNKYSYNIVEC